MDAARAREAAEAAAQEAAQEAERTANEAQEAASVATGDDDQSAGSALWEQIFPFPGDEQEDSSP